MIETNCESLNLFNKQENPRGTTCSIYFLGGKKEVVFRGGTEGPCLSRGKTEKKKELKTARKSPTVSKAGKKCINLFKKKN